MSASTIITDAHLPQIRQALADLDTLDKELELASRAGLNAGPGGANIPKIQADVERARAQLQQILNVYFPGQ